MPLLKRKGKKNEARRASLGYLMTCKVRGLDLAAFGLFF